MSQQAPSLSRTDTLVYHDHRQELLQAQQSEQDLQRRSMYVKQDEFRLDRTFALTDRGVSRQDDRVVKNGYITWLFPVRVNA